MICIYDKKTTKGNFETNGLGILSEAIAIEPVYLGITAVADTNLSMNFTMYCTASSSCTITIEIQLDNKDIPFTPKQKLQQGDNVIGIPLGIPQVQQGAHYIAVFLKVDTGTINIPMFNLQCMIDGRNLQGGLSAEHPHAECSQSQGFVNMNGLYMNKVSGQNVNITSQVPTQSSLNENIVVNSNLFTDKNITTSYSVSFK